MNKVISMIVGLVISSASAAQDMVVNVTSIVNTTDGSYGGCMANFTPVDAIAVQAGIANGTGSGQCSQGFISLDCDANFLTRSQSAAQLGAAQLALVTGNRIYVVVDATKKNSGYCTATRLDNLNS